MAQQQQPNYFDRAADMYSGAGQTYERMQEGFGGAPTLYQSMNKYLNPYTKEVADRAQRQLGETRDNTLNRIGSDAVAAGAFGGSRHGLVEAETYGQFADTEADMLSQLYQDRFNTAAQFGGQDVGNELTSRGINLNAMQGGAAGSRGIGDTLYNQGVTGMNTSMQYGSMAQQVQQQLMDLANQDVAAQQNWPFQMYQFLQGAAAGNPLMNERYNSGESETHSTMSGEQTTTSSPSVMDVLGDIISTASGFNVGGGGGGGAQAPSYSPAPSYSAMNAPVITPPMPVQSPYPTYGSQFSGYGPYDPYGFRGY